MHPCSQAGAAPEPGGAAALLGRLAAVEAAIRDDRNRQPATVVEAIARLWEAGATVPAIAAAAGASPHIVRDRLRRAGALDYVWREQRRHAREVLERRGADLIAAHQEGATLNDLAARAGVSYDTLRSYMVAEGVTLYRNNSRAKRVLEARGAELAAAYGAGASLRSIAAGAGINPQRLSAYCVAHGVAIRDRRRRAREILAARSAGLVAAYGAGASIAALAADAGVAHVTMRAHLNARGIAIRDRRGQLQEILEARGDGLVAAYEAGASLRALATGAGVSEQMLRAFLVSRGIRIRRGPARKRTTPDARGDELVAAYDAGASITALANGTGISPFRIRKYLTARGVAIRDLHWRTRETLEARGAELIAAYEAGMPISVLAGNAGICTKTLSKFFVAQGVRLRHDQGWYRRRRRNG